MSNLNPFSATGQPSSGGVSGPQQSYADYTNAQNKIANAQNFAGKGMGPSTNETLADAGANFGEALQLSQMSDANAAATAQLQNASQRAAKQTLSGAGDAAGRFFGNL